jgi:hypothetical protein
MSEKLEAIRLAIGQDGVHFTEFGRFHVFNSLAKTIIGLQEGTVGKPPVPAEAAASISVTGRRFYWRGFSSDRGSTSDQPVVVVLLEREGVVTHADEEAALAEAVNTATYRTARRRESREAAAKAVVGAASFEFCSG